MSSHPVLRAVAWMGGVLLSFMAMAVAGRELSAHMGTFEILAWRSIVGLVIVSILLQHHGWNEARTARPWLHLLRNSAHFLGQYGWFYGIALIPLSEVFAIEFTVPIWAALLAVVLLGEKMSRARWLAIGFGIAGTLLILRPGMQVVHPAAIVVLAGAIGYSISHVLTKKLIQTDTPLRILFFMTVMQLPMALIPAHQDMTLPSLSMLPWIVLVGSTALTAHYCMARAFQLADATVVVPLDFLRLPLIGVVGYLFYDEHIDLVVFAGALLMLAGNYISVRAATR
jgi:drug/metabolite transporter (DMT)-like permease